MWSGSLKWVAQLLRGPFPVTAAWTANPRKPIMARRACLISASWRTAFFSGSAANPNGSKNFPPGYSLFSGSSSAFLWNSMYPITRTSIQINVVMENGSGCPRYDDPSISSTWIINQPNLIISNRIHPKNHTSCIANMYIPFRHLAMWLRWVTPRREHRVWPTWPTSHEWARTHGTAAAQKPRCKAGTGSTSPRRPRTWFRWRLRRCSWPSSGPRSRNRTASTRRACPNRRGQIRSLQPRSHPATLELRLPGTIAGDRTPASRPSLRALSYDRTRIGPGCGRCLSGRREGVFPWMRT